jgi:hypothetical protein
VDVSAKSIKEERVMKKHETVGQGTLLLTDAQYLTVGRLVNGEGWTVDHQDHDGAVVLTKKALVVRVKANGEVYPRSSQAVR